MGVFFNWKVYLCFTKFDLSHEKSHNKRHSKQRLVKKKKEAVIVPEISHCAIFGCFFSMSCLIYPDSMRSFDVNSSNECVIFVLMHYLHVVHANLITEVESVLVQVIWSNFQPEKTILKCTAVLVGSWSLVLHEWIFEFHRYKNCNCISKLLKFYPQTILTILCLCF